jgi:hypothetical protein
MMGGAEWYGKIQVPSHMALTKLIPVPSLAFSLSHNPLAFADLKGLDRYKQCKR